MSKLLKIFFIIGFSIITLLYNTKLTFAATANMNLSSSSTQSSSTSTTSATKSTTTQSTNTKSTSNSAQYSTAVTASNFDLQLTNILSICLIVVGVLLILLSIAILIRLKH